MIISSAIAWQNIQIDGRKEVREIHTDDSGVEYIFDYMAEKSMDIKSRLSQRTDELNQQSDIEKQNEPFVKQQKIEGLQAQIDSLQVELDQVEGEKV